jgi:hypothetical protein
MRQAGRSCPIAFLSYGRVSHTSASTPTTSSADAKSSSGTRTVCAPGSCPSPSRGDLSLCGPSSFANALRPQSQNTSAPMNLTSGSGRGSLSGPRSLPHGARLGFGLWRVAGRERGESAVRRGLGERAGGETVKRGTTSSSLQVCIATAYRPSQ